MKVTLVSGFDPTAPSAGGVRPYVESLSRYLQSSGIVCTTVAAGSSLQDAGRQLLVPVRRFGSTAYWIAGLLTNIKSLPISNDSIVHVQRPDDLIPFAISTIGGARVCTVHGNQFQAIRERGSRIVYASYSGAEALALKTAHRLIFVDSVNASAYLRRYPWLEGRYDVIPNAVDTDSFAPADKAEAKRRWGFRGTVLLYAGRLQPEKRVPEIIRAFRDLQPPGVLLVVAGEGREASGVIAEARGLNVRLLGSIARNKMPDLLNAADALVLYSTREGLPTIALEALACGVPVITTRVGGLPELLIEGKTGVFVGTRAELTQAMASVKDAGFAGPSAIRKTIAHHSWAVIGPKVIRSYLCAEQDAS